MDLRHTKWKLQIAATVAYRAAAVRHLVRHSQSGGRPDWSDTDKPLRAAPKLKPPALPGDTYSLPSNARAQLRVMTVAGVQQHCTARKASLTGPADLRERDLRLGLEAELRRHARFAPTFAILSPVFWQIQLIGHRQACIVVGDRQRYRNLAVRLLAKLP